MTIFPLCLLLHQFWHLFNTSFSVFHFLSVAPLSLCSSPDSLPGCQTCGIRPGKAGMHGQGQAAALPADTPVQFNLECHQPWLWLWHAWPDGHLTNQRRKTLAAVLRRNQTTMTATGSLSYPLAIISYVPFSEVPESHHRSPARFIAGQFVVPHLQVRAFKEQQSEPGPMKHSVSWSEDKHSRKRIFQCLHACLSYHAIMIHSCGEPGKWVITLYVRVWKELLPSSFLQRTRGVILFKSPLAWSYLTQVPDLYFRPREMRKTRNLVACIVSWSWMMLIALKVINFRKHSLRSPTESGTQPLNKS